MLTAVSIQCVSDEPLNGAKEGAVLLRAREDVSLVSEKGILSPSLRSFSFHEERKPIDDCGADHHEGAGGHIELETHGEAAGVINEC